MTDRPQLNPWLKLALDLGPLLLFFFANAKPALFEPWLAPLIPDAVRPASAPAFSSPPRCSWSPSWWRCWCPMG